MGGVVCPRLGEAGDDPWGPGYMRARCLPSVVESTDHVFCCLEPELAQSELVRPGPMATPQQVIRVWSW